MDKLKVGVCITGSFCTLSKTLKILNKLKEDVDILPILSFNVAKLDTRFFRAQDFRNRLMEISPDIIDTIEGAEPIGPKNMTDIMLVLPCTGNTLSKLAHGITDTPVTMAIKSHIRNNKKVVIALATNDGMGASFQNIAKLYNTKNYYFVPYAEDNPKSKPKSLVYREDRVIDSLYAAIDGKQLPMNDE